MRAQAFPFRDLLERAIFLINLAGDGVAVVQIVVNPLTTTLTATADTYIDGRNATSNFGPSANLFVDGKPDNGTLLKWDLSSIPTGSTLQLATLSINVTGTSADAYEIYEVKRSWSESRQKATDLAFTALDETWRSRGLAGL